LFSEWNACSVQYLSLSSLSYLNWLANIYNVLPCPATGKPGDKGKTDDKIDNDDEDLEESDDDDQDGEEDPDDNEDGEELD